MWEEVLVGVLTEELPPRSRESRDEDRDRLSGVEYAAQLIAKKNKKLKNKSNIVTLYTISTYNKQIAENELIK